MGISRTTTWVIGAALLAGIQLGHSQQSDPPGTTSQTPGNAASEQQTGNEVSSQQQPGNTASEQPGNAASEEQETSASATKEHGDDIDVKNVFRNVCSFCHQDYGRKAGKGPQLMNSPRSDEYLFNIIKHGKAGRMAAFGTQFTDDQIMQIVIFIRELEADKIPPG
jgi:mono/diheme cytochrome c family protein